MDLRQLRYFEAVARLRNFTRAAEELCIAQPPLSRQVQLLEDELGVTLIVRNIRPLKLTDAGRLFHEHALQVLNQVEQMKSATRRVGLNERSVFSIGFVPSTLYGGLPTVVRKLRQNAPELDIQLVELLSIQQVEALKSGRIDVGFGRLRLNDPGVERTVLREERLMLASPPGSSLSTSTAPVSLGVLKDQKLILFPKEPRPNFIDQVLTLLADHQVRPGEVQEVRELQTALGLVAAEAGLCVIPAAARLLRTDLHYRLIDDEKATTPIIFSHRANDKSPYLKMIQELVQEMYDEKPPWLDAAYNYLPHWEMPPHPVVPGNAPPRRKGRTPSN
ncbi:MAG: LysR family transcriptional regulator [Xanthobacter sp.]